jgi:hypothetical protein
MPCRIRGTLLQAVLKLSDVHHADVTAKEWVYGSKTLAGNGAANMGQTGRPPFFRILDEYLATCDPFAIDIRSSRNN